MKPALILASVAIALFAWMFRYDVSGHVGLNNDAMNRPVLLDRWTGKTYIYFIAKGETEAIGSWADTGPTLNLGKFRGPWTDYEKK